MGLVTRSRKPLVPDFDAELKTTVRAVYFRHLSAFMRESAMSAEAAQRCADATHSELRDALKAIITNEDLACVYVCIHDALIDFGGTIALQAQEIAKQIQESDLEPDLLDAILARISDAAGVERFLTPDDLEVIVGAGSLLATEAEIVAAAHYMTVDGINPDFRAVEQAIAEKYGDDQSRVFIDKINERTANQCATVRSKGGRPPKYKGVKPDDIHASAPPGTKRIFRRYRVEYGEALGLVANLLGKGYTIETIGQACPAPLARRRRP